MSRQRLLVLGALLLVLVVAGVLAVFVSPDGGTATGIWPVGVATGGAIVAGRRWLAPVLLTTFVVAIATIWAGGRPPEVAVGYALGTVAEVWLIWRLLTRNGAERPRLQTHADMRLFFGATFTAGGLMALVGMATSALTGFGDPLVVALALGSAHLASELTLLPFFVRLLPHPSMSSLGERLIQWALILVVTPLVFLPTDFPSLMFLVIPLLGWCALRNSSREAMVQMLALLGVAIFLTSADYGPLAHLPRRFGLPVDARGVILATFAVDCALIVIPLMLTVARQLENARQAAAERDKVQNIVNSATGVAIIGTDPIGRITLWNPGAEKLLGYRAEEMMGQPTTMLHSAASVREKAEELGVADDFISVALALATPESAGRDMKFMTKGGEERTHSMTLTRMTDERGRVTGHVSTSEDVTDRVLAQGALVDALETERRAVERLREIDQVKDTFVSSVSHELRTPITSIVGYLELLSEGELGELNSGQSNAVRRVSDNSARLLLLIDDLLTLSRVQDASIRITDRAFDLREVVQVGHDVVSPSWATRDLSVTLELPDEPIPFLGDKHMVERVLVNLIGNAVKFTPDGGRVGVRLVRSEGGAVISVSDTGIGVPASEQGRLFSRFFRSSVAQKRAIPGSGLGLSIAKAVVEKHGGTVRVESELDVGTTFHVWVPIVV